MLAPKGRTRRLQRQALSRLLPSASSPSRRLSRVCFCIITIAISM